MTKYYQAHYSKDYGYRTYSTKIYTDRKLCWEEAEYEFRWESGGEVWIDEVELITKTYEEDEKCNQ